MSQLSQYVLVLRPDTDWAHLSPLLGRNVVRADDFEHSAVRLETVADADVLFLNQLQVAIVRAVPDELQAWRAHAAIGPQIMAIQQARTVHVQVQRADDAPALDFDESEAAWGLQVTGVARSRLTGRGVRVAVLDSALDVQHPDFARRSPPPTLHSFTGAPADHSNCLHGTAVTGILAGPERPADLPRYGVAPECELFFGRVMSDGCGYSDPAVIAGLEWALRNGCRAANLSLGRPVAVDELPSPAFEEICRRAAHKGMIVVAAAGNLSQRDSGVVRPVEEPANCLNAFAVGAIDLERNVASFSNGGLNPGGGAVDAVAPGKFVLSAGAHAPSPALRYGRFNFTSMATPFVTGIAALWLEKDPQLTVCDLWQRLTATAQPLGDARDAGAGLIQAPA